MSSTTIVDRSPIKEHPFLSPQEVLFIQTYADGQFAFLVDTQKVSDTYNFDQMFAEMLHKRVNLTFVELFFMVRNATRNSETPWEDVSMIMSDQMSALAPCTFAMMQRTKAGIQMIPLGEIDPDEEG